VPVPYLSHWEKPLGQAKPVPVGDKLCLFQWESKACPNWDWERSKETSPCPMGQVIYPRWRPFLVPGEALYPRWSLYQFHLSQLVPQFRRPNLITGLSGWRTPDLFVCLFVWVSKTQPNHWTKRMMNTRLAT